MKSLKILEYPKVIEMLTNRAISPMGKKLAGELLPLANLREIESAQQETTEASSIILQKGSLPLGGIKDISDAVKRASAGGMLTIEELLGIGDFLYVCGKVIAYGKSEGSSAIEFDTPEILPPYFDAVYSVPGLETEIRRCILNQEEIADAASPKLADIRRKIRASGDKVRSVLNGIIHSAAYKNMLQESIVTIRGDRYCVPVKAEHKAGFPGMVHDQSASGATLFMEPAAVVELNNKIKELFFEERREIERILLHLSGIVANQAETLNGNAEILTRLDFIFAKGELSLAMRATPPIFNEEGYINIRKGRHPLLDPEKVVPVNVHLGRDFTTLLITGPNTGGKTVVLKTIGLLTLMGQAGLHIPAFDKSQLAIFEVFADIGDEQSIEQSLSTFSSHMTNIVQILQQCGDEIQPVTGRNQLDFAELQSSKKPALVLLDELGAGTDPTEGAALAIAILEFLHKRQIRAAVTTHYSELKTYALSTDGVENASCEFNVETLRPTYRLLIGIPGKSNAFAISQKLGLSRDIIENAKTLLSKDEIRFEDVITDLEISKKAASIEKDRAEEYRREAETLKEKYESQQEKLKQQRERILKQAKEEALQIAKDARSQADSLYKDFKRQLKENAKDAGIARKALNENVAALENEVAALSKPQEIKNYRPIAEDEILKPGDSVLIKSLNQSGVVAGTQSGKEVWVQTGALKVKVKLADLLFDETASSHNSQTGKSFSTSSISSNSDTRASVKSGKSMNISPEIDLRGMMSEEACAATGKYLDDAYLAGLSQVTVIHGKGTGALRKAIHLMLRKHPYAKNFRLGTFGEGEDGVTVVEF